MNPAVKMTHLSDFFPAKRGSCPVIRQDCCKYIFELCLEVIHNIYFRGESRSDGSLSSQGEGFAHVVRVHHVARERRVERRGGVEPF